MKKKQFMSKLAALTMAAAMGITALPATAVFAAETQTEASDAQLEDDSQVTVTVSNVNGDDDTADAIKSVVASYGKSGDKFNDNATAATLASTLKTNISSDETLKKKGTVDVTDAAIDKTAHTFTANVVFAGGETYAVTVNYNAVEKTLGVDDPDTTLAAKQALDDWFAKQTLTSRNGVALTTLDVLDKVAPEKNSTRSFTDSTKTALAGFTFSADTKALTEGADGKWTGTIKLTKDSKTYNYDFEITVKNVDGTQAALLQKGVEAVNGKTYPNPDDTNGITKTQLLAKITKDINTAAGADVLASDTLTEGSIHAATAKKDGSIVQVLDADNGIILNVKLAYSSSEKNTKIKTALDAALTQTDTTGADILYAKQTDDQKKNAQNADALKAKIFDTDTALSLTAQATTAKTAATSDEVKKVVENYVTKSLTDAKLTSLGATVTVAEADDVYTDTGVKDSKAVAQTKAKAATAATSGTPGKYIFKVTESLPNDVAGYDKTVKNYDKKTLDNTYYVIVETNTLAEEKATAISVADQTVAYKNDTNFAGEKNGTKDSMTISLTPTLTPADSNSAIAWTVTGKNAAGEDIDAADFKFDKATTYGTAAAKLLVKNAGTYTVTATYGTGADEVKATATVTVTSSFKDVPAGAYYNKAVQQAYAADIAQGIGDNKFDPNGDVTRGQFVTFLYRYAVKADPSVEIKDADVKGTFSDVPTTSYYAKAVQWASANKIALGTGDGKFDPDAKVTRGQAVTFIYRAKSNPDTGASGAQYENTTRFTDLTAGSYYVAPVTWGVNNSVVSGLSTTEFGPEQTASRAQAITFIARAYTDNGNGIFTGIDKAANR